MLRELRELLSYDKHGCFPGKMCSDLSNNHGCGQKKPEGTSSAMFGAKYVLLCFNRIFASD